VILFYTRGNNYTWNKVYQAYEPAYIQASFTTRMNAACSSLSASLGQGYATVTRALRGGEPTRLLSAGTGPSLT